MIDKKNIFNKILNYVYENGIDKLVHSPFKIVADLTDRTETTLRFEKEYIKDGRVPVYVKNQLYSAIADKINQSLKPDLFEVSEDPLDIIEAVPKLISIKQWSAEHKNIDISNTIDTIDYLIWYAKTIYTEDYCECSGEDFAKVQKTLGSVMLF